MFENRLGYVFEQLLLKHPRARAKCNDGFGARSGLVPPLQRQGRAACYISRNSMLVEHEFGGIVPTANRLVFLEQRLVLGNDGFSFRIEPKENGLDLWG
ncbi:hypothetical protein D3C71_1811090 [compost metagenome]